MGKLGDALSKVPVVGNIAKAVVKKVRYNNKTFKAVKTIGKNVMQKAAIQDMDLIQNLLNSRLNTSIKLSKKIIFRQF